MDHSLPNLHPKQIRHLEKRAKDGASHILIATELNSIWSDEELYQYDEVSGNDVERLREALSLPGPDEERAKNSFIIAPSQPEAASSLRPASSAFSRVSAPVVPPAAESVPPRTVKVQVISDAERDLTDTFGGASRAALKRLEKLLSQERDSADITIKHVYPQTLKPGKTYVVPGIGPMVLETIGEETISGHLLRAYTFREAMTASSPKVLHVPQGRITDKKIRELTTPEMMDDVLYGLYHGTSTLKGLPKTSDARGKYLKQLQQSEDLGVQASLIITHFRNANETGGFVELANESIKRIAAEYAVVKDADLSEAITIVSRAARKPTLDQLRGYSVLVETRAPAAE